MPRSNESIVRSFFSPTADSNELQCICKARYTRMKTGWTNFTKHLRRRHAKEFERAIECEATGTLFTPSVVSCDKTLKIFQWLDIVINTLQPFSICESETISVHTKYPHISVETLMSYMKDLTLIVEAKIASTIPETFAIILDGWSYVSTHYLGVLASWPSDCDGGYDIALLALSPLDDETTLSAMEHEKFIKFVLSLYGKTTENFICVVADNNATNKLLASSMGASFIGCASHRFNLAMKDMIANYEEHIEKVQIIMKKLRSLIPAAKLRKHTKLTAVVRHQIRWSSTFQMLVRYQELREYIPLLHLPEVSSLALSQSENALIDALVLRLKDLESVCKQLQREHTSVSDTRALFDAVIDKYPETNVRLNADAKIVADASFESALVKIQRAEGNNLSEVEHLSVVRLTSTMDPDVGETQKGELDLAASALLQLRQSEKRKETVRFSNTKYLLPTSNHCERLNSVAGRALGKYRNRISPETFEQQMFLNFNQKLWDITDVQHLVNKNVSRT